MSGKHSRPVPQKKYARKALLKARFNAHPAHLNAPVPVIAYPVPMKISPVPDYIVSPAITPALSSAPQTRPAVFTKVQTAAAPDKILMSMPTIFSILVTLSLFVPYVQANSAPTSKALSFQTETPETESLPPDKQKLTEKSPAFSSHNYTSMIFRMLWVLAVVLILAYLSIRFLLPRLTAIRHMKNSRLTLIERLPIDQKKVLYLVRADNQEFLLGGSDNHLTLLQELSTESKITTPETEKE